jgi:hypothetical protein
MRSFDEYHSVQQLVASGMDDCAIARKTGIPRTTVCMWRRGRPRSPTPVGASPCGKAHDLPNLPARAYAYLLGMYLGDGCISAARRVWVLRVALDRKYPSIIEACRAAIDTVMPGQHAAVVEAGTGYVFVSMYSKHWPCLFPQHGPGRKHNRLIELETPKTAPRPDLTQ